MPSFWARSLSGAAPVGTGFASVATLVIFSPRLGDPPRWRLMDTMLK
jgi:hypothetical protein